MNPWDLAMLPAPARLRASSAPERPWPRLVSRPAVPMPVPGILRAAAPIAVGTEWTVPLLERFDVALAAHARRLQLDTYPIQYEVITAAQMIDLSGNADADIGISLPGTGEAPAAPVFIDGEKALTLRGEGIANEFQILVENYIEKRFGQTEAVAA